MIDKIKVALVGFKKALAVGGILATAGEALVSLFDKNTDN